MFQWIENHVRNAHASATNKNLSRVTARIFFCWAILAAARTAKMLKKIASPVSRLNIMTCTKYIKHCLRQYGLDENIEGATANQSRVVLRVLVEIESQGARLLPLHHFAGGLPDVGFDAAAADRAEDGAVIADEHLCRLVRGDGAADIHDGGDGTSAAFAAQLDDLLVNVHPGDYFGLVRASQTESRDVLG